MTQQPNKPGYYTSKVQQPTYIQITQVTPSGVTQPVQNQPDYMTKDEGGGFVYLVEAQGFHGVLSFLVKRRKIGLSNNPERRLKELNSEQSPCPIVGIRYIEVKDNSFTEKDLHAKFAKNRKHGEWFDFWIWELPLVDLAYERRAEGTWLNKLSITSLTLAIMGVMAIGFSFSLALKVALDQPVRYQTEDQQPIDTQGVKPIQ